MLTLPRRRIIFVLKVFTLFVLFSIFFLSVRINDNAENVRLRFPPQKVPQYECPMTNLSEQLNREISEWKSKPNAEMKVLVFVETLYSKLGKQIIQFLDILKISRKVETISKNLPLLTTAKRGRFSLIIFENYYKYLNLPIWNRQILDKYCRDYDVGIISFIESRRNDFKRVRIKNSQLSFIQNQQARNLRFNKASRVRHISKAGAVLDEPVPDVDDWLLFYIISGFEPFVLVDDIEGNQKASVILDLGKEDGIERILFGHNFTHWLNKIAFIDSLRYLSKGIVEVDLKRYIQIDIDDIFVGATGTRITKSDADALLDFQNEFRRYVSNFTYTLGFSGYYFRNGDSLEDEGDERLIEIGRNFIWFPHMWRHNHAHEYNETYLRATMTQNKLFAKGMNLPISSHYAVSPQHAGVYPVHEPLYNAWRSVWDVLVTSTEEYPHFRPPTSRRGFIHLNISVLPRQTCGLYTHTQFFHSYPDGFAKLVNNIEGGDLFFTLLSNVYSVFMTHQQNYANDRLGIFTFKRALEFMKCWTNLEFSWMEPLDLARAYFQKYPNERTPVWSNPCTDARHLRILPLNVHCSQMFLPNLLIIGPQKTGSTAFATYLTLHPNFTTNLPIPSSFEELQFFGGSNYNQGLLWYMDKFRSQVTENHSFVFEKSATYFDNGNAPHTAAALIPKTEIVIILIDPSLRAYSWYHHMRAHGDPTALNYSLTEILNATASSPLLMRKLRNRCISPGRYAHHIERWLEYFPLSQFHIIDGDEFKNDPAATLENFVNSLHMPAFDFANHLTYDTKKGFYCLLVNGSKKCLGASKGRKYTPIDSQLKKQLDSIFMEDNIILHRLLNRNDMPVPKWLRFKLS